MPRERKRIDAAAARWFGLRDGGLTPAQEFELTAWLRADPRHAEAFDQLVHTSSALDRLAEFRPANAATPDPDLPLLRFRPRPTVGWRPLALATAAALVIAYVGWWRPARRVAPFVGTAVTEVGRLEKKTLPDGSVVELNTNTALEMDFTPAERRVRLTRGEAHFTVAKNPARPFIVTAGGIAVRAVGTAFNVCVRPERIEVLVTEGRVEVDDTRRNDSPRPPATTIAPPLLEARQHAIIPVMGDPAAAAAMKVNVLAPADVSRLLAWQEHRLEFEAGPLREVVAEFNRYNRHQLVIGDAAAGDIKVGGYFRADDYETFVRLLESSFGVAAEWRDRETILRAAQ